MVALFAGIYLWVAILSLIIGITTLIAWFKLFEKAGERGWKAIVPFYSFFVYCRIATGNCKLAGIYLILCFVYCVLTAIASISESLLLMLPLLAIYAAFIVIYSYINYQFGKAYGRGTAWCILMIFLANILTIVMAFDSNCKYVGPKGEPATPSYY
jgi:hypothetical protein